VHQRCGSADADCQRSLAFIHSSTERCSVPQRQPLVLDRGPTSVWSPADSVSGTSCSCFLAAAAVAALFSVESFYIITRNAIESATECL